MNKTNLCVICTKNPNEVLLNTINGIKRFYTEFDIVVIDSDSTNMEGFKALPSDVTVEFIKNKNWELGAWTYAYNKYNNYKVYMFYRMVLSQFTVYLVLIQIRLKMERFTHFTTMHG